MSSRPRLLGVLLLALVLLGLWGAQRFAAATSPAGKAEAATDAVARRVADGLDRGWSGVHDPAAFARRAAGRGAEVLEVTGDPGAGTAAVLVRITTTGTYTRFLTSETITDVRCYRIAQRDPYEVRGPREQVCRYDATPLTLPPEPVGTELPDGYDAALATGLRRLPVARRADPAAVAAVARDALGGSPARVTTERIGGTTGVAVATDRHTCVLAAADAEVDVWRPARVYLEPGEAGCTAASAATRQLTRPPH